MSFEFTIAGVANAISWCLYGVLIVHDPVIYTPNALGLLAGLAQLTLFAVYGVQTAIMTPSPSKDRLLLIQAQAVPSASKEDYNV
jgi:hypothetical protein